MGFFDDIVDFVSDIGGDGVVGDIIGPVATIGGTIASTLISNNANEEAARRIEEAERARIAAIEAANQRAIEQFRFFQELADPAFQQLRRDAAADPFQLTPFQQQAREDALRDSRAAVASSGLRGAGRSGVAAIRLADQDFINRAVDFNTRQQDQATSQLANAGFQAGSNIAGIEAGQGAQIGQAGVNAATTSAGATTANADNLGIGIQTISNVIADEFKRLGRPERTERRPSET